MSIVFSNIDKCSKVLAFTIYGDKEKYTLGLIANLILRPIYYPDFCTYIYFDNTVPPYIINTYKKFDEVMLIDMTNEKIPKMMWRFLPCDTTEGVELFISRDCDSRISHRESEAVYQWIKSENTLHIMRDHPCHYQYAVYGGLFGLKDFKLKNEIELWTKQNEGNSNYGSDCLFLSYIIFERMCKLQNGILIHDSLNLYNTTLTSQFPSKMNVNMNFVGETINIDRVEKEVKMIEKYRGRI